MKHNGGLLRIREALHTIRPAELNAANYILKHPEEVVSLSVKELAEKSNSSQSAIIRLCQSIGVKGFSELKVRIAGDLQGADQFTHRFKEILPGDDIQTIINNVSTNNVYSIHETLKVLDSNEMKRGSEAIFKANRIDFYGAAASQIIAQDAQQKFLRINKHCTAYADAHLQLTSSVTLTESDVAIGISYSGETNHVLKAIENAKETNAVTIGITRYGQNSLAKLVDICLYTSSIESDVRSSATASRIAQLNIIDILFRAVASLSYDTTVHYLNKSHDVIRQAFRMN